MATLSSINIKLGTQTAGLERGFANAGRTAGQFGDKMNALAQRVALVGVAMGAALTAAAVAAVRNQLPVIDDIAKTADRLGTATEPLIGLAHAAGLAGASQEELFKSLEKMERSLGEAVLGTGEAKDALLLLGLSAEELSTMSADEAFIKIADAISKLDTQAAKVAAAADIFGRSGVKLINVMDGGAASIRAAMEEVEELGLTFSRYDASKVEAANDAMTRLTGALTGLGRELTIAVAPALTTFANSLIDLVKWMGGLSLETVKNTVKLVAMATAIGGAVMIIPKIIAAIRGIILALKSMTIAQAIAHAFAGPSGWLILAGAAIAAGLAVWGVEYAFSSLNDTMADAAGGADKAAAAVGKVDASMEDVEAATEAAAKATEEAAKRFEMLSKAGESLKASLRTPLEKATDDIQSFNEMLDAGAITWETYSRAVDKARKELADAAEEREKFEGPLNVGAVTRQSVAGFSAVINAQLADQQRREEAEAIKKTEEHTAAALGKLDALIRVSGPRVVIEPVGV